MSLSELKKQLKELRPKFGKTEEDLKKELDYHLRAKKSLEAKERMMKVREAKMNTPKETPDIPKKTKVKEAKEPKEAKEAKSDVASKREALLAQLASLNGM